MSRQSYSRRACDVCGGKTAGNAFARDSHASSKRHREAMRAEIAAGTAPAFWSTKILELDSRAERQAKARENYYVERAERRRQREEGDGR